MRNVITYMMLLISVVCLAQDIVVDETNNVLDLTNSSEKIAEEKTASAILQDISTVMEKVDAVMDTINNVMNTAGQYIATAREVEQAASKVAEVCGLYKTFVDDISNQQMLAPSVRLKYVNQIISEVLTMQKNFNKILTVSGKNGDSGHMNDGQRLKLVRTYLSYISGTCDNIKNIYSYATGHAARSDYNRKQYISTMCTLAGF